MSSPASRRTGFRAIIILVACAVFLGHSASFLALAQESSGGDQPNFIRDAEIENYLRALATPIYRAADVEPDSVSINLVESNVVNAFVADGMNEFFYTGLLQLADTPEQMAGVIAHETGHIAGGHLIRGKEEMRNASGEAILGMILAVAAGAAAGNGSLAAGALSGSQQIAERSFLSFSRSQEASADAAGMSFLDKAQISTRGMLEFFQKLAGQELLPFDRQAEYVRTHPLTQDRIDAVQDHLDHSPYKDARLPEKYYVMHDRMKAKLLGYLQPENALLRYTDNDKRITARYARGIALYRTGKADRAIIVIDTLLHEEPDNPFFNELKGQILFENGRVDEALPLYKKANTLLPDSALLHEAYGHALLESKDTKNIDVAIRELLESNRIEEHAPSVWHLLASAWGRKAELTQQTQYDGMATYALAEETLAEGHEKSASQLADRAMKVLPKGSAYWLRAQDIKLSYTSQNEHADDKKKKEP